MEKKNLIFALGLSILVITVYQLVFMPKKPVVIQKQAISQPRVQPQIESRNTDKNTTQSAFEQLKKTQEEPKPPAVQIELKNITTDLEKNYTIETDVYTAVFSNKGAALKSFILRNFKDDGEPEKSNLELIPRDAEKIGL